MGREEGGDGVVRGGARECGSVHVFGIFNNYVMVATFLILQIRGAKICCTNDLSYLEEASLPPFRTTIASFRWHNVPTE